MRNQVNQSNLMEPIFRGFWCLVYALALFVLFVSKIRHAFVSQMSSSDICQNQLEADVE
jgi:hypothetical protein